MTQHAVESEARPRERDPAPAAVAGLVAKARAAIMAFAGIAAVWLALERAGLT